MTRNRFIAGGACAASFVVGIFVGYQTAKLRLEQFYDERASREIGEANTYFKNLHEKSAALKKESLEVKEEKAEAVDSVLLGDAVESLVDYGGLRGPEQRLFYHNIPQKSATVPATTVEIEEDAVERARRAAEIDALGEQEREQDPTRPYVISSPTFLLNEGNHEQSSMAYYAGDKVLTYDTDEIVDDSEIDSLVGRANLDRFGGISEDPEMVFIRNDRLQMDFEIVRSDGKYSVMVAGLDDDGGGSG